MIVDGAGIRVPMNGVERILKTFAFEKTDGVAVFEQAVSGAVVSEVVGRQALGSATDLQFEEAKALFAGRQAYEDFIGRFKEDTRDFVAALDLDMVSPPWFLWEKPTERLDELTFHYENPFGWCIRSYDRGSRTYSVRRTNWDEEGPQGVVSFVKRLEAEPLADTGIPQSYLALLKWYLEQFGQERCVAGTSNVGVPMNQAWWVLLVEDPGVVRAYLDILVEVERRAAEAQAALGIKVVNGGGDLAAKNGPVYSPAVFQEIVLPRLERIIGYYHTFGGYYIFRTDGNIWSIADPLFIESGTDAFGEIDVDAGMDLVRLRERYPRLVLWGGLSCGALLLKGTTEEIRAEAERLCTLVAPTGGWIAGSSNSLLPGTNLKGYCSALEVLRSCQTLC
jgi:hypothetical protein